MKKTIYFDDFKKAFEEMDRIEQFSEEGLKALFDYLEEFEKDTGIEIELDVIALCCDFTEYEDFDEFKENYSAYVEEHNIQNLDDLADYTIVIRVDEKAFIIQDF